jgi:hypothetical protein
MLMLEPHPTSYRDERFTMGTIGSEFWSLEEK